MSTIITPEMIAAQGSEDAEQIAVFVWAQQNKQKHPELEWLFAIPNGGSRDKREGGKLVAAGVKRGVPDIMFPVARRSFHGMFIEMKKRKNFRGAEGELRPDQEKWQAQLCWHGYYVVMCIGWTAARDALLEYMSFPK